MSAPLAKITTTARRCIRHLGFESNALAPCNRKRGHSRPQSGYRSIGPGSDFGLAQYSFHVTAYCIFELFNFPQELKISQKKNFNYRQNPPLLVGKSLPCSNPSTISNSSTTSNSSYRPADFCDTLCSKYTAGQQVQDRQNRSTRTPATVINSAECRPPCRRGSVQAASLGHCC